MARRVCKQCGRLIHGGDYCTTCAAQFKRAAYESLEKAYHNGRHTFSEYERLRKTLDLINWATEDG